MLVRVASAVVLIPVVLALLYIGGGVLVALVLAAAGLAAYEFGTMFHARLHQISPPVTALLAIVVTTVSYYRIDLLPIILLIAICVLLFVASSSPDETYESRVVVVALNMLGGLYVGMPLAFALLLRELPSGFQWTLTALLLTWAVDSGGFFVGRRWGRHKLSPRISPGKTWEGAAGGLILSMLIASACATWLLPSSILAGVVLGIIVAVAAVAGDLAESLFKRAAMVKDSGTIIPGHGGVLDRIDSLLFVLPVTYYLSQVLIS